MQLNIKGTLVSLDSPVVMGIFNVSPDSFYSKSVKPTLPASTQFIDLGGCSTRPGGEIATAQQEKQRLTQGFALLKEHYPHAIISVDTFRPEIAQWAVTEQGAAIINDVSGGNQAMFEVVAQTQVPYVLTYPLGGGSSDMLFYFSKQIATLTRMGVNDIILDPGFGFGKTLEQNYEIAQNLTCLQTFGLPVLVGISRKSMIQKVLGTTPQNSLLGTCMLHSHLLERGAHILRVHDVEPAQQTIAIYKQLNVNSH
ncbi:MAG: dihydropteroate synthase [Paludibacteraceae bacterium]|nr:dihydropteroate synthase [Paludibacteraceae bacterium]